MERYTKEQAQIYVTINGTDYQGWLESSIERSIENISHRFTIPVTYVPGKRPDINRQDIIKVRINETLVTTGYVLTADPFYRKDDCGIKIQGRSRTGDLVTCSAIHKGGQWRRAKLNQIARDLCSPFGIDVLVETDVGAAISEFTIRHGESVLHCISRAARMRGVLVTANMKGQLVLTKAGKTKSHGAIVRGQNVISMEGIGTDAERFSQYIGYGQQKACAGISGKILTVGGQTPDGVKGVGRSKLFTSAMQKKAVVNDPEIKRYLPLIVNAEGNTETGDMRSLVNHTMRVRRGQAYGIRYRLEGWTWKGKPWEVNTRVPIYDEIAELDGDEWLICEVTTKVDLKDGDVADVLVRPVDAYDMVPIKPRHKKGRKNKNSSGGKILTVQK